MFIHYDSIYRGVFSAFVVRRDLERVDCPRDEFLKSRGTHVDEFVRS